MISFEENLNRLEKIVTDLEKGNIKLDQSLQLFEEGMQLVRVCQKKLETVERKVEIILNNEDGTVDLENFGG